MRILQIYCPEQVAKCEMFLHYLAKQKLRIESGDALTRKVTFVRHKVVPAAGTFSQTYSRILTVILHMIDVPCCCRRWQQRADSTSSSWHAAGAGLGVVIATAQGGRREAAV